MLHLDILCIIFKVTSSLHICQCKNFRRGWTCVVSWVKFPVYLSLCFAQSSLCILISVNIFADKSLCTCAFDRYADTKSEL